jgi:hypothetical protein
MKVVRIDVSDRSLNSFEVNGRDGQAAEICVLLFESECQNSRGEFVLHVVQRWFKGGK